MGRLEEYQCKRNQVRILLRELLNEGHDAIEHYEALERKLKKSEQDNTKSETNAYENGLKEAWTLIQDVFYMQSCKAVECFGEDNFEGVIQMDVKEALQKYREYEYMQKQKAESEQLKAGDEVINRDGYRCVILHVDSDSEFVVYNTYYQSAYMHSVFGEGLLKKTGRTFPELAQALKAVEAASHE